MDFSALRKGLFSVKEPFEKKQDAIVVPIQSEKITYVDYGFHQAGRLGGTVPGLKVCLQKVYLSFKQEVKDDQSKQEELKKPYRVKIEDYKGENKRLANRIDKIKEVDIPRSQEKIEQLKEELSHIRKNPQEITGDDAGKASFYIGGVILLFLTIYLFIFYSSASYSGFFKEFTLNEVGVASSIFDAKALSKAFHDGTTELALILTIPFVFIGLGYLIHKFQEQKSVQKYFKIGMLIIVTFIFDSILAYEITEKIYNLNKNNSFKNIINYSIPLAFQSINFWLIIFAGFVVYLIWGFVFDFVMDSYRKIDKVKIALDEKEKEIKGVEFELHDLEIQIDKITYTIGENDKEINKLCTIIESTIISREFELDIFNFMAGWLSWMRQSGMSHSDLNIAEEITREFVRVTITNSELLNS